MNNIKTTKAIRFKLENAGSNREIQDRINNLSSNNGFDLVSFVTELNNYIDLLNGYLFCSRGDRFFLNDKFILKKEWMKNYAKQELVEFKTKTNNTSNGARVQYTVGDYRVESKIQDAFDNIDEIYGELCDDASRELNERSKHTRTALLLKRLYAKNNLPLLIDFVENSTDKKEVGNDSLVLKSMGKRLMEHLELGIQEYLPEQSVGVSIAKASFNYYTINKKPIAYDAKIKEIEKNLVVSNIDRTWNDRDNRIKNNGKLWKIVKADIASRQNNKQLCIGDSPFMDVDEYASLRQILKNILSEQKADFDKLMQRGGSYKELQNSELYLFKKVTKDEFDEYSKLTEDIEELATKRNQTKNEREKKELKSQIERLSKQRGSLISEADKTTEKMFKTYKAFSVLYKKIAQKHGKELAKLKGIEKEKAESQTLQYWAMILEKDNRHKLVLIPKAKSSECRSRLVEADNANGGLKLYWFESFTYRSLQKLCFGNIENGSNTFYPQIRRDRELGRKYSTLDKNGYSKFISGEHEFKGEEQRKIQFYQDVLRTDYARKNLNLPYREVEDRIINSTFESLDDFKIALESICYRRAVCTNIHLIDALESEYGAQIFDITSLDLRREDNIKDKEEKYSYSYKSHTAVWKEFWTAENEKCNFDIRLNPEISIIYRKAKESRIEKYGVDSKKNNRYLHDQLTLVTTLSEHCNSPERNIAFATIDEEERIIAEFNSKLDREIIRFAFGIDNGEVELSTLGVYLPEFKQKSIESSLTEVNNVDKYGFDTLTIRNLMHSEKDVNGRDRRIIDNPSYFLKEDLYCRTFGKNGEEYKAMFDKVFEQRRLLTLDLSTAKVICGRIVTNGDVISLYNLWLRHAQRNIYDMNEHIEGGGAKVYLKKSEDLNDNEKRKFLDYLNDGNKKYEKLSDAEKKDYINWIYKIWDGVEVENKKFTEVNKKQKRPGFYFHNVLLAASYIGEEVQDVKDIADIEDIRHVFKFREDFKQFKPENEILDEINKYNIKVISNEELDLRLNQLKSSLVANVIGVIDYLYKQYKERFGGEGIIAKEGFGIEKVESDRMKFSGNIYRMLERKLYQKFQNYGMVPPIKNLTAFRSKDKSYTQIGYICFINYDGTSQRCPICDTKLAYNHGTECSAKCGFDSEGIMHSNDGIAGYNIAKKGFESIVNK